MQNREEIQLLSPVFWSLPFSDSWWTSIILLPDLHLDLSRSHSHHCVLQAESCVSASLCKLCAWKALHFPCNFSFAWFQIATLSKVSNIFKPFQSISHLNCQRRSKCLYGHTAGSRFCGGLKNMQKSKDARVMDPSVTKTFAPRSARLLALLSCDGSCVVAGCSCLSGLNEIWYDSKEQRGVWGWEEHLIWQCLARCCQKACAKIQYLSPATNIVIAFNVSKWYQLWTSLTLFLHCI